MTIELPNIFGNHINKISEFTIEDFRSIAFMIENDSDNGLYGKLISKIIGSCSSIDKFNLLFEARIKYVSENIVFNIGESNLTVNLEVWRQQLLKHLTNIQRTYNIDNITITLDYPYNFYYNKYEDILVNCIKMLKIKDKILDFETLDKMEKEVILDRLPSDVIDVIKEFINNNDKNIILMESKLGLPEISINFFNNSAFSLLKTIYSYYTYEDILELIFILSKRIGDISYINSRTPRDLFTISKLYEEELEKLKQEDN